MFDRRPSVVASIILLLVSVACADGAAVGGAAPTEPEGAEPSDGRTEPAPSSGSIDGSFVLVDGRGANGPLVLVDSHQVTLTLDGKSVGGTAACNSYGGTLNSTAPEFTLGEIARTEMACSPDEVMVLESAYLQALGAVTTVERTSTGLTLTGPEVGLTFEELPSVSMTRRAPVQL